MEPPSKPHSLSFVSHRSLPPFVSHRRTLVIGCPWEDLRVGLQADLRVSRQLGLKEQEYFRSSWPSWDV
ncbi:hypothetical protein I3843_11G122800 [Carya illinoinensis]|nr:hypothetical protein I3843_11G122800 [Carya illinoinensis]